MGSDSVWMLDFFGSVLPVFLVLVFGILLLSAGKGILQWNRNNRQPLLTVDSRIVSKRSEVKQRHSAEDSTANRTQTQYYITFEVDSGDRLEFPVSGKEYGVCAEGDEGRLSFQGTRYCRFERYPKYRQQFVREFDQHRQ